MTNAKKSLSKALSMNPHTFTMFCMFLKQLSYSLS